MTTVLLQKTQKIPTHSLVVESLPAKRSNLFYNRTKASIFSTIQRCIYYHKQKLETEPVLVFSTQSRNADALFLEYLCRQQLSKTGGLQQAFFNYRCIKRTYMA